MKQNSMNQFFIIGVLYFFVQVSSLNITQAKAMEDIRAAFNLTIWSGNATQLCVNGSTWQRVTCGGTNSDKVITM
jgi:hypothetical protein